MHNLIIPALLVKTEKEFREKLRIVDGIVSLCQIDVMDGHFVPNTTWCDFDILRILPSPMQFELHLMVSDPYSYIQKSAGCRNIKRIIWHIETNVDHISLIRSCHSAGFECGLAINPTTPKEKLSPYAHLIDEILIMGVNPGFSGQGLLPDTIEKAKRIRENWPHIPIGFDGGVIPDILPTLKNAGVTRFCAASSIFKSEYPQESIRKMENA